MKKKTRNIILSLSAIVLLTIAAGAATGWYLLFSPQFHPTSGETHVFIDRDDDLDNVITKIREAGPSQTKGFELLSSLRDYGSHIRTGHYVIYENDNTIDVFRRLERGQQEPVRLTINSARTFESIAGAISRQIMEDSVSVLEGLSSPEVLQQMGFDQDSRYGFVIPNTYEVYWNISVEGLIKRLKTEYDNFWNESRKAKAKAIGLTPKEVSTLASIVEEETQNAQEKPIVAGLYMNRINRGIPLQADPTVVFAKGMLGQAHRVTNDDLKTPSPYNTYLIQGLPPGPIRIPSTEGLNAVLGYTHHNYIYMCAKEDFSGTHNFAVTLAEHNRNAQRYWAALNARKIYH